MNRNQMNLQDMFLNQLRKQNAGVTIFLVSGVQLKGTVSAFDSFTLILDTPGKGHQLIYKHAISSIVPAEAFSLPLEEHPEHARRENTE